MTQNDGDGFDMDEPPEEIGLNDEAVMEALSMMGLDTDQIQRLMEFTPTMVKFGQFIAGKYSAALDDIGEMLTPTAGQTQDPWWVGFLMGIAAAKTMIVRGPGWVDHIPDCTCIQDAREASLKEFGITITRVAEES